MRRSSVVDVASQSVCGIRKPKCVGRSRETRCKSGETTAMTSVARYWRKAAGGKVAGWAESNFWRDALMVRGSGIGVHANQHRTTVEELYEENNGCDRSAYALVVI